MTIFGWPAVHIAAPASGQSKKALPCGLASGNPLHPLNFGENCAPQRIVCLIKAPTEWFHMHRSWCGRNFKPAHVRARPDYQKVNAVKNDELVELKSAQILQPGLAPGPTA